MAVRINKTFIPLKNEEKLQLRTKSGPKKKNISFLDNRAALEIKREKPAAFRLTYTPHDLNRVLNSKLHKELEGLGSPVSKKDRKSPTPPAVIQGFSDMEPPEKKLFNTTLLVKSSNDNHGILKPNVLSPKVRRQIIAMKQKSRNPGITENLSSVATHNKKGSMFFTTRNLPKSDVTPTNVQKKVKDLEAYAEILQSKVADLENELEAEDGQKQVTRSKTSSKQFNEVVKEFKRITELYASLSSECIKLKENESALFDEYINICQEKEKIVMETEKEASQQRVKIRLLQEALTKRNEEFSSAKKKSKELEETLEGYERKMAEIMNDANYYELKLLEYENGNLKDLSEEEISKRVSLLTAIMEHEKSRPKAEEYSGKKGNMKEKCDPQNAMKKDSKKLNNADVDLLFPTQLKSYYASSEL